MFYISEFRFADPWFLLLLASVPALWWRHRWSESHRQAGLAFPQVALVGRIGASWAVRFRPFLFAIRLTGLILMILAFARPQLGSTEEDVSTEGVDIILGLDVSGSMAAEDFRPRNRISVAKQVMADFVKGRRSDRIGLVVFAARSLTRCPLTIDYDVLLRQIESVELGVLEDGTAIGSGMATAVNRLRSSKARSRVVILVTDGVNNSGEIDPQTAAQIAASLGIKVYTVGVGKEGVAPFPVTDPVFGRRYVDVEVKIDESSLRKIAELTSARYFRAIDRDSLQEIFKTIDALEKSRINVKAYTHYNEIFGYFLWPALALLAGEIVLSNTRFRRLP
ncbi:MAG: VWA domain-containing protein [Acidobacteriota bacterium]